jgi:predicted GNAT superfamily acetyltransferase
VANPIEIRECVTVAELSACVGLQREVFALPDLELSPVRHLIVTKNAGGFTLGAFDAGVLAGFVLSVPGFLRGERAFYSHMTAVRADYQSAGIGQMLKWAQRERSLKEGVRFVKWTFEPVKARNAYFNLEKLGAIVSEYAENFYGTDYGTAPEIAGEQFGLASDRLFAEWHLEDAKVEALAASRILPSAMGEADRIEIPNDWLALVRSDPAAALAEQMRIRAEFQSAFGRGFVARGFSRGDRPAYLLYSS